jgi:hypothetical protein
MGSTGEQDRFPRMFDIVSNELDERGNRVIEVELAGLATHREAICEHQGLRDIAALRWTATRRDQAKTGALDPADPRLRLVFDRGVDRDGVWEVRVEAEDTDARVRDVWRQDVFVQKAPRLPRERIDELARRYAPVFVFSAGEQYFPVSFETMFNHPLLARCDEAMTLRTVLGKRTLPLCELGAFMCVNGHADYLLDFGFFGMKDSVFGDINGSRSDATVYYSYLEDPASDRFFINYHLFYTFDAKVGLARLTGIGPHVFDRESMVLVFEGGDVPTSMVISGHLENQTVFLFEKLKIWNQGRIRVLYDDPRTAKLGEHPVVAVAEGSHALYPTSGIYHISLIREIAGYLHKTVLGIDPDDGGGASILPDQILVPPSCRAPSLASYGLRSLGLDRLTSRVVPDVEGHDGHNAYLVFSGYWVDVPGLQNTRFPPFTRKERDVEDWVDNAYPWVWDDLPANLLKNNEVILEFLAVNVESH